MKEFWRVCKRLANDERMDVLRVVMLGHEEGLTVNGIADSLRIGQPATSQYLRQLEEECCLVRSRRDGRYVTYWPAETEGELSALISSLRLYFLKECRDHVFANGQRPAAPPFSRVLPALANVARVKVLWVLREKGRTSKSEIMKATGLSEINVRRHAAIAADCGLAEVGETAMSFGQTMSSFGAIVWKEPHDPIARMFVELSHPVTYCNM